MTGWLTGGVAVGWLAIVAGLHRLNVRRLRRKAQGFGVLRRLDWDVLLLGLAGPGPSDGAPPSPPEGGPGPQLLAGGPAPSSAPRHAVLSALVRGEELGPAAFAEAGFTGAESAWLGILAQVRRDPERALAQLESHPATTVGELYLREHLAMECRPNLLNVEVVAFGCRWRLTQALQRFEGASALHFARARASSLLGFQEAVLDDLARAVYFSRQAPFYLRAVLDLGWIEDARPPLFHQCRVGLAERSDLGSTTTLP